MTISKDIAAKIIEDFNSGISLRTLEKIYNINRKKISKMLKDNNIYVRYKYTEEEIQEAIKLFQQGLSLIKISEKLNIDRHILSQKLIKLHVKKQKSICIAKEDTEGLKIKNGYIEGYSIISLAKMYNRSTNYVYNVLSKYGVEIRDTKKRIYHFDEHIFETINTEHKAYWLGFLYADGYIDEINNRIELTLCEKDKSHLEKFVKFINATPSLKITEKKNILNNKIKYSYRMSVCSKEIVNNLVSKGCFQNKSLNLTFPSFEIIPKEMICHFMRGYFDGDGSITLSNQGKTPQLSFSILGTKDFCTKFEDILFVENIINKKLKLKQCNNIYVFSRGGNIQAKKFYDFLYRNSTICLERKKEKFNAVLNSNI